MENQEAKKDLTGTNNGANETETKRPRRRLNPVVKWVLIGTAAATTVGVVTYLIVKGKKVPAQAVEKIAETTAEVAATV